MAAGVVFFASGVRYTDGRDGRQLTWLFDSRSRLPGSSEAENNPMADTPVEKSVVAGDSQREEDLGTFLLTVFCGPQARVGGGQDVSRPGEARRQRPAFEGRPPADGRRRARCALNRGPIDAEEMVRLLVPMMDGRNRRIFRRRRGGLRPFLLRGRRGGGSASTC